MNFGFLSFIFYVILCGFDAVLMTSLGYNYANWECWCSLLLIIGAFVCGRIYEKNKGTNKKTNEEE